MNDISAYFTVSCIQSKDRAAEVVKHLIVPLETVTVFDSKNIQWIICDGGGEYQSSLFTVWLKEQVILNETIAP